MRQPSVVLLGLLPLLASPLFPAETAPASPPRLSASCLGAAAPGAPARIAVSWTGSEPLELQVWGDADRDRLRDAGEEIVAERTVEPGFKVLELERMPEAPLAVGSRPGAGRSVAAVLADGCAWSSEFFLADLDGVVRAFAVYDDGSGSKLYVAGDFVTAGDQVVNHIATWDGASWAALSGPGGVVGTDAAVRALAIHASSLYVGGDFTAAGGLAASHLARWGASGWENVGDINGPVHALISFRKDIVDDWRLYAGGSFTLADGVEVSNIARRSGTTWETVGTDPTSVPGVAGPVYALERCTDGGVIQHLFVSGDFDSSSGGIAHNIARWNGSTWSSVGSGAANGVSDAVRALECKSGVLYVGGDFVYAGNAIFSQGVASWSGTTWSSMAGGMFFEGGASGQVLSLAFYNDGTNDRLYAGGNFHYAGGQPAYNLAAWTGAGWTGMIGSTMTGMNGAVLALGDYGGELHAGGWFVEAGGVRARHAARWSGSSVENWRALEDAWGWGFGGLVRAFAVYDEGDGPRLFAGGEFLQVGATSARHLARWDGAAWMPVESDGAPHPGSPAEYVTALAVHDDGGGAKLFIGLSAWPSAGGGVVAWDGVDWIALENPGGGGLVGDVYALESFGAGANSRLYAGGALDEIDGEAVAAIARWDGSEWSPVVGEFSPVNYIEQGAVYALEVYDAGSGPRLYAGGNFNLAQGSHVNLARWDGSNWSGIGAIGPNAKVGALAVFDDGGGPALFAGGAFTQVDAVPAHRAARWDGSGWTALAGPADEGTDGEIYDLAVYDDASGPALYATGPFLQAGGIPVERIARWDGSDWSNLPDASGRGLDAAGLALISHDDGSGAALWVGGGFDFAGDAVSTSAARWSCGLLFKDDFEGGGVGAWDVAIGVTGGP